MALDDVKSLSRMRFYYYSWFTLFYAATIGVGLLARVAIPVAEGFDAETVLLLLSRQLLSPFFIGIMLGGGLSCAELFGVTDP